MPFDLTPQPILDPSVRDLPPRERLEKLRDWLYAGGPGEDAWCFTTWMSKCGTIGCAGGWYENFTGKPSGSFQSEFSITKEQDFAIFLGTGYHGLHKNVTPQDVATVIDQVLES